jgi:BatD DUF11 like domain
MMDMRRWWIVLLLLLAPLAQAANVQAFLDRNHVSLGDTVTLNIQSSGSIGTPDLSPLQKDFDVLGASRSSSMQIVNGKTTSTSQLGIALKPLRTGTLTIPALDVDGTRTQPLTLQVGAAPTGGQGKVGDPAFMETSVQSSSPYVDQQTIYTVRLFYEPGADGTLQDPDADGARLIQLDRDHRYMTERNGYTYKVIERSWALIPERTGPITVHGPVFTGQQIGAGNLGSLLNNPNALLNNPNALLNAPLSGFGKPLRAVAPDTRIDARGAPSSAGKPWLPARDVELKLTGLPADGKASAGVPLTVTLSISASGVPADALPEPQLPPIAGAKVYPDQTQDATDDSGEWLQGSRTRSFAIVPAGGGTLTIPAITLNWWDVVHDRAEQAALPMHALHVSDAAASAASVSAPPATTTAVTSHNVARSSAGAVTEPSGAAPISAADATWRNVALASLALCVVLVVALLVVGLWWRRRKPPSDTSEPSTNAPPQDAAVASVAAASPDLVQAVKVDVKALQRHALDAARASDAAACERALLAWARAVRPGLTQVGVLREALGTAAQRDALDALQRARWRGGDVASACAAIAAAFASGFAWRDAGEHAARGKRSELPPLYPM